MTVLARGHRPLRSWFVLPPHKTTPRNRCAISQGPRIAARFRGGPGLVIGARS